MQSQLPKDILKLINAYSRAQQELVKIIAEKEAKGNVTNFQQSLLKQITQELKLLDDVARQWVDETIPKYYQQGIEEAVAGLQALGVELEDNTYKSFSMLHREAIIAIVTSTYEKLNTANNFIGRRLNDAIRQAGIDAVTQKMATGQTVKECKKNLVNTLLNEGLNGIRDKRDRLISLDAYASTVARSTTREATNTATMNQLTSLGYDLVKMSSHNTTCPICSVYQGRIYSISGKDSRYPRLDKAFGDHANIHPNCRHVLMPYIPQLVDDSEKDTEFSNRSFDIDSRNQKTIDEYNRQQKGMTQLRNDRNQYQRYKLSMPKDTPKSFAAFRKMKYSNSGKYNQLESNYRSLRQGGEGN